MEKNKDTKKIKKDSSLELLREISTKDIAEKTYIGEDEIVNLLQKKFANLNHSKALGFINILSREYNIDLKLLKDEYLEYKNTYVQRDAVIIDRVDTSSKSKLLKLIIVVLFIALFLSLIIYKTVKNSSNKIDENFIIKAVKEKLKSIKIENNIISEKIDIVDVKDELILTKKNNIKTVIETSLLNPEKIEKNLIEKKDIEVLKIEEKVLVPKKKELNKLEDIVVKAIKEQVIKKENKNNIRLISIIPKTNLWFGVIDLKTNKRKQYISKKPVAIVNAHDTLIITGHGYLKVNTNIKNLNMSKRGKLYIYKTKEDINIISVKEARILTNGKLW